MEHKGVLYGLLPKSQAGIKTTKNVRRYLSCRNKKEVLSNNKD
jgi:hypothetical protein